MTSDRIPTPPPRSRGEDENGTPTPVIVHLSGALRGTTQRLAGEVLRIGSAPHADIHLADDVIPPPPQDAASLHRHGITYELRVAPGSAVWVNGEQVEVVTLQSGDLLEIGNEGPVLRFRLYEPGVLARKSLSDVVRDCMDCARYGAENPLSRAGVFIGGIARELRAGTSSWFRAGVLVLLVLLTLTTVILARRSFQLERRLEREVTRVSGLAELLERSGSAELTTDDLLSVLADLQGNLSVAKRRIEALEEGTGAAARVVALGSGATVFLQGSYGFTEPSTGRPLRLVLGPDGQPLRSLFGEPAITAEGDGPVLEIFFTGTAFVATSDGLLLSNRHVALPWDFDEAARRVAARGYAPAMQRFVGYLPSIEEPFDVEILVAHESADLALLRCSRVTEDLPYLELDPDPPLPGEEVIVLGYPLGIRALMARTDARFVQELTQEDDLDFWTVALRLSQGGHIAPLASRGIVGQVTSQAIVYDAETTSGGSGGPVLDLDGRVVAINAAILPEFGGSNLGVPAAQAEVLVGRASETPEGRP